MNRTRIFVFLLCVLVTAVAPCMAQDKPVTNLINPTVQDTIATIRARIQADRQVLVAANMGLTEDEGKAFWPVYREYRADVQKLGDRTANLIVEFGEKYDTLTDEQASHMLQESLEIRMKEASLKIEWSKKFSKVLSHKKVARFFQIENKLDLLVMLDVSTHIPLVN